MGLKIIFMGTPTFAVPSLRILVENGYNVVAVVTSTDKMGGRRGKKLLQSAVKQFALENGIKVLQPKNLKSPEFNEQLTLLDADLQVVVAFRMLPEMVWNRPKLGTFNLHGSLLPKYRGAAPINWAIIKGERETGVTSFKLKHEIDTGSILFQRKIPIYPFDYVSDLHDRMKWIGADVILETVQSIERNNTELKEQNNADVSHAPKLNKENTKVDFKQKGQVIYDMVRGLSPYPTSWFDLDGKHTKIYKAAYRLNSHKYAPGTIISDRKTSLNVATTDGYLELKEIQMSGKKRMDIRVFLNGYNVEEEINPEQD